MFHSRVRRRPRQRRLGAVASPVPVPTPSRLVPAGSARSPDNPRARHLTREHVYQRYVLEGYPAISAPTRRSHGPGGARCRGAPGPPTPARKTDAEVVQLRGAAPARKTDAHKRTGTGARIHAGAAASPDLPPVDRSDLEDPHGCGDEGPRPGASGEVREDPHGCGDEARPEVVAGGGQRGPAQAQRRDSGSDNARPIYVITTPRCHNQNPVDFRVGADPADGARAGANLTDRKSVV